MNLLPFQVDHATRLLAALRRAGVALDASDAGVGKTYVAADVAKRGGWKVAVIAPKATIPAWEKVCVGFAVPVLFVSNYEAVKLGKTGFGRFCGKDFEWKLPADALLVFDEAQRCKARDSQNARMLIAARRQGVRTLLCSATAAANPLEMRALGYALGLHRLHDFWPWAISHGCRKGRFGFEFGGDREALEQLHRALFQPGGPGSRLRIAEIPGFPETQIICEPVGTGHEREIQEVYDQMARDLAVAEARCDHARLSELAESLRSKRANHLTILLRARQEIEALKADAIVSMAKDAAAEGLSVAVFLNFDATVGEVAARLGTDCLIVGGQSDAVRADAIRRFQENHAPFLVANIKAGGVGVSLHDPEGKQPRLALISPTYSAQDLRQCLGRVHRTGGAHSIQRIVFAAGTVEERVCAAVEQKLACIDLLNDGDFLGPILETLPHGRGMSRKSDQQAHAKYSPSGFAYREICAGFINRDESGPAAEEGTLLHKAVETGNLEGLTDEQRQCVEMCRAYVEDLEDEVYGEGEPTLEILREHRVAICDGATFGTLDYALFNSRLSRADLVDFKFGRLSVPDAEVNPQIQAYVLGLLEENPGIETLTAHILLPRRDEVSRATYSREDIPQIRLRISTIIARCEAPDPELRPTENCLWCARQATCAALHRHALTIAAGYEDELKLPEEFHPGHITDPSMMSRALVVAKVMEKWCDSVKHHALKMRLEGQEIPGHELRSRAGTRKISDPLAAWAAVRDRISPDQFIGCTEVSLPKLESIFAEAAPRGAKAKAKQELCEALADLGIVETAKESLYLAKTRK